MAGPLVTPKKETVSEPQAAIRIGPSGKVDGLIARDNNVYGGGLLDNQGSLKNFEATGNAIDFGAKKLNRPAPDKRPLTRDQQEEMARRWVGLSHEITQELNHYDRPPEPSIDVSGLSEREKSDRWERQNAQSSERHRAKMQSLISRFQGSILQAKNEMIDRGFTMGIGLNMTVFRPVNDFEFISISNQLIANGRQVLTDLGLDPDK